MGFLKDLGSIAGHVAGGVVGGTIELVGEVTNSKFIKDVGVGVYHSTARTGEIVGSLASGSYDAIGGLITRDTRQSSQGLDEIVQTVEDTALHIGKGVASLAGKGIDTVGAVIDGDTDKVLEMGKDFAKIAAVGIFSVGIIDFADGIDSIDTDLDADIDGLDEHASIDNPNTHHVTPHTRILSDGTEIWVDGDGNTSVDTFEGWDQHNPDYQVSVK